MADGQKTPHESRTGRRREKRRERRRFPGLWLWLIVAGCAAGVIFLQMNAQAMDFAIAFIGTWGLIFLAVSLLFIWFVAFSAYQRQFRLSVLAATVLINVVFWTCFKIDHVWGELFPALKWRFSPDRDETLAKPKGKTGGTADLSVENEKIDFPGFLGPGRSNHVKTVTLTPWDQKAPRELWRRPIGAGWGGFAAVNGYAVTLEQRGEVEWTTCYRIESGELIWSNANKARHKTILGGIGPRSTPMIHRGKVYTQGATGVLTCLDGRTGKTLWRRDLLADVGSTAQKDEKVVFWGRAGSPLVVDDRVLVPLGGPSGGPFVSLGAFNAETGDLIWQAGDRQVSYSSPTVATINGIPQALIVNEDNISGHRLNDGKQLWSYKWPGDSTQDASASQVVPLGGSDLFVSKGYGRGAARFRVTAAGESQTIWNNVRGLKTKFTNVVIHDGFAYGLSDGILECLDLQDGKRKWKKGRYGQGQILGAGHVLLVQAEVGELYMIALDPQAPRELGMIEAMSDKSWNNLCLFGNRLLVRNSVEAVCYELATE